MMKICECSILITLVHVFNLDGSTFFIRYNISTAYLARWQHILYQRSMDVVFGWKIK